MNPEQEILENEMKMPQIPEIPTLKVTIFENIGEASMCWDAPPSGIFDSSRAEKLAKELVSQVTEIHTLATRQQKAIEILYREIDYAGQFTLDEMEYEDVGEFHNKLAEVFMHVKHGLRSAKKEAQKILNGDEK